MLITITSVCFISSLGIMMGTDKPFETAHKQLKAPHLMFIMNKDAYNVPEIKNWFEKEKYVEGVTDRTSIKINNFSINNKKVSEEIFANEINLNTSKYDKVKIIDGKESQEPKKDEIWISPAMASSKNVHLDDKFEIDTPKGSVTLRVSAIVADVNFNSQMGNQRLLVSDEFLNDNFPKDALNTSLMGIRLTDVTKIEPILKSFEEHLGKPFDGMIIKYDMMQSENQVIYKIVGMILFMFSMLMIVIAVYVLFSVLSETVITDYKKIGIMKMIGFTPGNVVLTYMFQILAISFVAIVTSGLISFLIIKTVIDTFVKSIGSTSNINEILLIILSAAVIIFAVITLFSYIISRKASKVSASQAIRHGEMSQSGKVRSIKMSKHGLMPLWLLLGINRIKTNKRQSFFIFASILAVVFTASISSGIVHSVKAISKNRAVFGMDLSDIMLSSKGSAFGVDNSKILESLKADKDIEAVAQGEEVIMGSVPKDSKNASLAMYGCCYSENMDALGLLTIKGKNPQNKSEIAISETIGKKYNKQVGDNFNLYIMGKSLDLNISGIFKTSTSSGDNGGFRITYDTMKQMKNFEGNVFFIKLKKSISVSGYAKKLESIHGDKVTITEVEKRIDQMFEPIFLAISAGVFSISLLFTGMMILIVFISTILLIDKNKNIFSMYKTLGFTPNQIKMSILSQNIILMLFASIVGVFASANSLPALMDMITEIDDFPYIFKLAEVITISLMIQIFVVAITYIASNRIAKLKLRILLTE